MGNRRESIRVTALVLLLTVVGVAGGAWTDEVSAQERLVLSRPPVAVEASMGLPGGSDVLIAVGTLQFLGIMMFEAMAWVRRRNQVPAVTPPLAWRVPSPYTSPALESISQTRQAA